jgi:Fe-S cluster assembly protein SufD
MSNLKQKINQSHRISNQRITKNLLDKDFDIKISQIQKEYVLDECKNSYIVFINGILECNLSKLPDGIYLKKEKELEFSEVTIAVNKTIVAPLQIVNIYEKKSESFSLSLKINVIVSNRSKICLINTLQNKIDQKSSMKIAVLLEKESNLKFINFIDDILANFSLSLMANVLEKAKVDVLSYASNISNIDLEYVFNLREEKARIDLSHLGILSDKSTQNMNVAINHQYPNTYSNQNIKNILNNESISKLHDNIKIESIAQKSDAKLLSKGLIFDDKSICKFMPNMEIFADDVKASHGATISQLDEKALFYLQTRGLDIMDAKKLTILGFCSEILKPLESFSKFFEKIKNDINLLILKLPKS